MEQKYVLVSDFSLLPEKVKQHFSLLGEDFAERKFTGILKEEELIAFISYSQKNAGTAKIVQLWMDLREGIQFRKTKNISPMELMFKGLIKNGIRVFQHTGLTPDGKKMFERFIKKKLLQRTEGGFTARKNPRNPFRPQKKPMH